MKKHLPPLEELSEDSQRLFDVLNQEPDLAAALIGANYLDQCLGSMLGRYMVQGNTARRLLDPVSGPLGTFIARMNMSYALGLINKFALTDLQVIAEIRNTTAHHHLGIGFDAPEIREKIERLRYLEILDEEAALRGGASSKFLGRMVGSLRDKFNFTVVMLSQQLLAIGLGLKPREPHDGFVQAVWRQRSSKSVVRPASKNKLGETKGGAQEGDKMPQRGDDKR